MANFLNIQFDFAEEVGLYPAVPKASHEKANIKYPFNRLT